MLSELKIADVVRFLDAPQIQLKNKQFTVCAINKYKFKNATNLVFKINNGEEVFYIADIIDLDGSVAISRLLTDEELSQNFNLQEFSQIFLDEVGCNINSHNIKESFNHWIEPVYTRDFEYTEGVYYSDCQVQSGSKFYYYTMSAENSSIDVEVLNCGKVLFYITIYLADSYVVIQ